jgi:hypothetical protein
MKRSHARLLLVVLVLGHLYCLSGIAMAYWVASLPNATRSQALFNFYFWVAAACVTALAAIVVGWRAFKAE